MRVGYAAEYNLQISKNIILECADSDDLCRKDASKVCHMTWVDSFYFSVITASTIGFGDMQPLVVDGSENKMNEIILFCFGLMSMSIHGDAVAELVTLPGFGDNRWYNFIVCWVYGFAFTAV